MGYLSWLEGILFVLLMGLSAFFSSSETALFSLSSLQLEKMRQRNHPRVDLIERLLTRPRRLIMTILIGNELVNVSASVISATFVIYMLGEQYKWLNLFVMVPILLLVGEITPKTLAIRNNIAFAGAESRPIEYFARIIKPLRVLVRTISEWIITLIVGRERSQGNIITEDLVRTLAHEAVGEGALDHTEAQFIEQIFDFGNKTLGDVMTPRSEIFFLPLKSTVPEMIKELHRTRHTKVPVYQEHRDNIVGILYARDLLGVDLDKMSREPQIFKDLLREPYFVPESKPAAELFDTFRERRMSCALTVDEYGGITGLVTMEDLLECIFGDIHSPSDVSPMVYIKMLSDNRYRIDGAMPISDLNREISCNLPEDRAETIGGLVLHEFGELPPEKATIQIGGLDFSVVDVDENRIKELHLERSEDACHIENEDPADGRASKDKNGRIETGRPPAE